jgi:uncharacterized membrane protein YoaK (UPF0700 family)
MVDFTGFFTLGHIFTAHVTGNIVLAAVVAVDGGSFHWAQLLAIPVFMLALATRLADRPSFRPARFEPGAVVASGSIPCARRAVDLQRHHQAGCRSGWIPRRRPQ